MTPALALTAFAFPLVTLDCSSIGLSRSLRDEGHAGDQLLDWVRSHPNRQSVHVVLRTSINDRRGKILKNRLQALGCTVTARVA
jgi:hypothetical protein